MQKIIICKRKPFNFNISNYRPYTYKDIIEKYDDKNLGKCTSVPFSDRFILTAAHCLIEQSVAGPGFDGILRHTDDSTQR